jgi:hypothetical protein
LRSVDRIIAKSVVSSFAAALSLAALGYADG